MSRYNMGSVATLDDAANALLLRADFHIAFDKPRIAFFPKLATTGEMRLVAHMLEPSMELEHLYHNRELHPAVVSVTCCTHASHGPFLPCSMLSSSARLTDASSYALLPTKN
jgi:hypothetical protein